jgi:hypothetical protein
MVNRKTVMLLVVITMMMTMIYRRTLSRQRVPISRVHDAIKTATTRVMVDYAAATMHPELQG